MSHMLFAFLYGLGLFSLHYVVGILFLVVVKLVLKPGQELFRKLLHLVCFTSVLVLQYGISTWYIAASVAVAFAILVYPIICFLEKFPSIMRLLQQRKNGEIRSSIVLVFLMMAALTFVFWGCLGEQWKYITVVSVMAWGFGDGAAALVGKRFGRNVVNHRWVGGKKTREGSIAMYAVAALSLFLSLFFLTTTPWYFCLIAALCVAPICSVVELFSRNGTDTITVPFATAVPTFLLMNLFSVVVKQVNSRNKASLKREKTMLVAFLLSSPGPILTGIAAVTSGSATQIADFIRRSAELVALFVAWWVYRKMQNNPLIEPLRRDNMTGFANKTVAIAMICSGVAMGIVGLLRFFIYSAGGNVVMGYIIAILGLLTNAWFWWRYWSMNKESFDPVVEGQRKLYRAKACVDSPVVVALTSVLIAPKHHATQYIDAAGCVIVAFYLVFSGIGLLREEKPLEKSESASEELP